MNHFKKKSNKLEKSRGIFFQIGLIVAGGLTLLAFEWMTPIGIYDLPTTGVIYEEEWEIPPIIFEKEEEVKEEKKEEKKLKSEDFEIVKELLEELPEEKEKKKSQEIIFDDGKWEEAEEEIKEDVIFFPGRMPYYRDCEKLNETERKLCTQVKMYKHFGKTIKIPEAIKIRGKAKYKAFVYFEVDKNGVITNVKLKKSKKNKIPRELERQAINAVNSLPQMEPGKNHGKKVTVGYMVPIQFIIKE